MSAGRMNICPVNAHTQQHMCLWADIKGTHTLAHIHRNTAGGKGSDCQGGGRWVGTEQTTLQAGSPYRRRRSETGSVVLSGLLHGHARRGGCNNVGQLGLSSCPVWVSEAALVLYRVKVSQGKHLLSFSPTNFTQVIKIMLIKDSNCSHFQMQMHTRGF